MENILEGWSKAIEESAELERKEHEEFNKNLREPDIIHEEFGYWRTDDGSGIIKMRRLKTGYNRRGQIFISKEEIEKIISIWR